MLYESGKLALLRLDVNLEANPNHSLAYMYVSDQKLEIEAQPNSPHNCGSMFG